MAEDSVLFREGLVRLLEERGHEIVAAVGDADALLEAVAAHRPVLAVVDIRMPPGNDSDGAVAAQTILEKYRRPASCCSPSTSSSGTASNLIGTPGFGYLLKDRVLHLNEFEDALTRVAQGGVALDPEVVQALVKGKNRAPGAPEPEQPGSEKCWRWSPRARATSPWGDRSPSPTARSRHTCARSSPSSTSTTTGTTNRRVRAVVAYLESHAAR